MSYSNTNTNNNNNNQQLQQQQSTVDYDTLVQKLEQTENIIEILAGLPINPLITNHNNDSQTPTELNESTKAATSIFKLYSKQLSLLNECYTSSTSTTTSTTNNGHTNSYSDLVLLYPNLKRWLKCLNISENTIKTITSNAQSFHYLYDKTDFNLKSYLNQLNVSDYESSIICSGYSAFKKYHKENEKTIKSEQQKQQLKYQQQTSSSLYNNIPQTPTTPITPSITTTATTPPLPFTLTTPNNNLSINNLTVNTPIQIHHTNNNNLQSSQSNLNVSQYQQHQHQQQLPLSSSPNPNQNRTKRKSESDISQNMIGVQQKQQQQQYNNSHINVSPVHYPSNTNPSTKTNTVRSNPFAPSSSKPNKKHQKVTTPPPSRKNSTSNMLNISLSPPNSLAMNMQRSSSYDSQARNKIDPLPTPSGGENSSLLYPKEINSQRRLSAEGSECSSRVPSGQTSPINISSPNRHIYSSKQSLTPQPHQAPLEHSWTKTLRVTNCHGCSKMILLFGSKCKQCKFVKYMRIKNIKKCNVCLKALWHGQKCKKCKIRCHKDCEKKCGACEPTPISITPSSQTPSNQLKASITPLQHKKNSSCESSSNASSCNSSGPNSPNNIKIANKYVQPAHLIHNNSSGNNLNINNLHTPPSPATASSSSNLTTPLMPKTPQFFPPNETHLIDTNNNNVNNQLQIDSKTSSNQLSSNTTSTGTTLTTVTSNTNTPHDQASTELLRENLQLALSNKMQSDNDASFDNYTDSNTDYNDSNLLDLNQSSLSLKEFDIKYEEITQKSEIGRGRFGTVYKAQWHGPHAVKEIDFDEDLNESSEELTAFKFEVLNLCKTRHANLILFVGACMKPPKLAIVMSLCRGTTLYRYLHIDQDISYAKPSFEWTLQIATHIAQGMGYLHTKNMLHKDLRSKNVFIDGNKAVISDFGLYSLTRLCNKMKRNDLIPVTKECLYYLAPELIRNLGRKKHNYDQELVFSQETDVFSFGTILYELFFYEFPFSNFDTHTIMYLIGSGRKHLSPNIQIAKEIKDVLLKCWSTDPKSRYSFLNLLEKFRAVPKRRIYRSPSHPHFNSSQIGRSLEALHIADIKK